MSSEFCTQLFFAEADKQQPCPRPWLANLLFVQFMKDPYPSSTGQVVVDCRNYIMDCAKEWEQATGVKFEWIIGNPHDFGKTLSNIRITFEPKTTFCYVGSEASKLDQETATMNFGWVPENFYDSGEKLRLRRMVLHLFGHALGRIHYRKNNNQPPISWKTEWLQDYYMRNYYWCPEEIKRWVRDAYNPETLRDSGLVDETSIMLHAFPEEATTDNSSCSWPDNLSLLDKIVTRMWYYGSRWNDNYGTYSLDNIKALRPLSTKNWGYIKYPTRFPWPSSPDIMLGINLMDQDCDNSLTLDVRAEQADNSLVGFNAHLDSNDNMRNAGLSWLAVPLNLDPAYPAFFTGEVTLQENDVNKPLTKTIPFPRDFPGPRSVIVWLRKINFGRKSNPHFRVCVDDYKESPLSFDLQATKLGGNFNDVTVSWLAYRKDLQVESGSKTTPSDTQGETGGHVNFGKKFWTVPKVLVGFSEIHLSCLHWWTLRTWADGVTKEGFDWHVDGPTMKSATVNWIAFL